MRVLLITYSFKKGYSENLEIKWTDSQKEVRVIIKNVLLEYSKQECHYLLNSNIMVYTWRKLSMISPQKLNKEKNL